MTVEDQLRQAMADQAAAIPAPSDRWTEIEAQAAAAQRSAARRLARRKAGGLTILAVAATAAAALIALPALTRESTHRVVVTPVGHPTTVVTPQPRPLTTTTTPSKTTSTAPSKTTTTAPSKTTTVPAKAPASPAPGYQPLYPFRTLQDANAWQAANSATGAQPWHLDAGQTALSFTGFLGYSDVTTVFNISYDATGAHVTVGFPNPNGDPVDSAVLHLRRFGTGNGAPWEVVGTDDTPSFSLTTPHYGAVVTSPLTVAGAITGVDESIRVEVLQQSSPTSLGLFCCQPAGNTGSPWGATVTFHGASDSVLIVAASTGGHLAAVERFTVTGVRTSPGSTPGL